MSLIDTFIIYDLAKKLVQPFDQWQAFKTGVIDAEGNILVPPNQRSYTQKNSFTLLDVLIRNIKRLIGNLPGGSSSLVKIGVLYYLLKEDVRDPESLDEDKLKAYIRLLEDAPANAVGGGQVAGVGVDNKNIPNQGEPGVKKTSYQKKNREEQKLDIKKIRRVLGLAYLESK